MQSHFVGHLENEIPLNDFSIYSVKYNYGNKELTEIVITKNFDNILQNRYVKGYNVIEIKRIFAPVYILSVKEDLIEIIQSI